MSDTGRSDSRSKRGNEFVDLNQALNYQFRPTEFTYDNQRVIHYALSVGAGMAPDDPAELQFVYELNRGGFRSLPTFAVIFPFGALEQIATQKWLALYPDGWEAWADLRRRDLPRMYPRMASDNPDVGVDELMRRLQFPPHEYNVNYEAVQDAIISLVGPDLGSTRLWWDPE